MKQEITFCQFCDRFRDMDRNNNFSYNGKRALYDWLEMLSDDTGEEYLLDVIALCCEFTEYEDLKEFQQDHSKYYQTIEDIEQETKVIKIDKNSFIIQAF